MDERPIITECARLGSKREGVVRSIKVTLGNSETVHRVLSRKLKKFQQHRGVYLSVDRTQEERLARKKLVEQLNKNERLSLNIIILSETIVFLSK